MKAAVAWRVTRLSGRYVASSNPVEISALSIQKIPAQNGWSGLTSANGATSQAAGSPPWKIRWKNAAIACRETSHVGRYVSSS